ncbi:hypothetical protein [Bacillus cereus group sp. BfR-BA-01380]|uniref:hypothetical protein n=1 Tax=Bacillus cereus group sp. BfR-BA-01380 TaxID=2920324 RepID=UPI001F5ACF56|nr:hypothetical protein [Bacillus cereus group sp. BfR-BA-01380]
MQQHPYNPYPHAYCTSYNLKDGISVKDVPIWSRNDVQLFLDGNPTPMWGFLLILSDGTVSGVIDGNDVSGFINRTTKEITFTIAGGSHGFTHFPNITYTGFFTPQLYEYTATGTYSDVFHFIKGTWFATFSEHIY